VSKGGAPAPRSALSPFDDAQDDPERVEGSQARRARLPLCGRYNKNQILITRRIAVYVLQEADFFQAGWILRLMISSPPVK
jgi:hypothetical protein